MTHRIRHRTLVPMRVHPAEHMAQGRRRSPADERVRRPGRYLLLPGALILWFGLASLSIAYVAQALVGPTLAMADPPAAAVAAVAFVGLLVFISERVIRAIL